MYRPTTTILATSPGAASQQGTGGAKKNSYARVIGSAAAGVSELLLFHPVDTVAKRLMSNRAVAVKGQPAAEAMATFNQVICVAFGIALNGTGTASSRSLASMRIAVAFKKVRLAEVRHVVRCAVMSKEAGRGRMAANETYPHCTSHITGKHEEYEKTRRHALVFVAISWLLLHVGTNPDCCCWLVLRSSRTTRPYSNEQLSTYVYDMYLDHRYVADS